MQNNKFEDIIKQKLESLEPAYQETDWQQFKNYSAQNSGTWENIFLKSKIFKTAAVIVLGGFMALAINMYVENKSLKADIAAIKQTLKNQENINTKTYGESGLDKKQSEYYVDRKNEVNAQINGPKNGNEQNFNPQLKETETNKTQKIVQDNIATKHTNRQGKNSDGKILEELTVNENTDFTPKNSYLNDEIDFGAKKQNKRGNKKVLKLKSETSFQNDEFVAYSTKKPKSNSVNSVLESENESIYSGKIISESTLNLDYLAAKKLKLDSTKIPSKQYNKNDFAYYKPQLLAKPKAKLSLADAYLRTAIVGSMGKGMKSYGGKVELFLDQRFSVSAGVNEIKHLGEYYLSSGHSKNEKNEEFKDKYKPKLPPLREVLNIKETSNIVTLPLRFNYNHPLSDNFNLIAGFGTDLDIKARQRFDFTYEKIIPGIGFGSQGPIITPITDETKEGSFYSDINLKKLNNIAINIGAEYRIGKLGIQGKITDVAKLKTVEYRKSNSLNAELGLYWRL